MGIQFDAAALTAFFGEQPIFEEEPVGILDVTAFDYSGEHLKYTLFLNHTWNCAMISGDTTSPFGADSLFEISVPCDSISAGPDPYRADQVCLSFWHGPQTDYANRTLTLMKRPDGDLKVWPRTKFPPGHASHEDHPSSSP